MYEDDEIVAVNKPSGVMTHADGRTDVATAEDWFRQTYPNGAGYVHRIDRETSGVLLFAKTQAAHDALRTAFHDHTVRKTYAAVVYGAPRESEGVIDFPIGRSRKDFRLRSAQPKARGRLREAVTNYVVQGITTEGEQKLSLLEVHPQTGRTHQIRVHLKAIHHPVVGDPLYAPNHRPVLGFTRLALHAWVLEVPRLDGTTTRLVAPLPEDFREALRRFGEGAQTFASSLEAC